MRDRAGGEIKEEEREGVHSFVDTCFCREAIGHPPAFVAAGDNTQNHLR